MDGNGAKLTAENCTATNKVGILNPFRYRSYYYDTETGLYFLQTRYYDPETGRFITIDDISYLAPDTINGLNLYAYCGNNPVMNVDPKGTSFGNWVKSGITALFFSGTSIQVAFSVGSYLGIARAAIFNKDIRTDMNNIGWNPFNANEEAVLASKYVSFYKGVPVFRTNFDRSGTFLGIFLKRSAPMDEINHEWGHIAQQIMLGPIVFLLGIGIPSGLEIGEWGDYYNAPWETSADILGGVKSRIHTEIERRRAIGYLGYLFVFASGFVYIPPEILKLGEKIKGKYKYWYILSR